MVKAALEKNLVKLSNTTLDRISENVKKPHYDRTRLKAGILHIGLGNFHRAHQAWFLHQLMQAGEAMDWAVLAEAPSTVERPLIVAWHNPDNPRGGGMVTINGRYFKHFRPLRQRPSL
ncbi:MAG: hypothetical protein ACPGMX_10625, partial [Paracoccaceae bacterium]